MAADVLTRVFGPGIARMLEGLPVRWLTAAGEGTVDTVDPARTLSYSEIYETQPIVAAAVNKLVHQIATLPLKTYRRKGGGERERVRGEGPDTVLNRPAPRRSPTDLKQWIAWPMHVQGNGLLAKYRGEPGGPPTELLPLDWRYISAYARPGGPVEVWETTQLGSAQRIAVEETVHFAWFVPGGIGVSPLKQLGVTVRREDAAQRYQESSFANAARPGLAVVLPPDARADGDLRDEIREEVDVKYGGVDKAFRTLVLGGGADVKPVTQTAVEVELSRTRQVSREEVGMVYDVPGPLIGDLTHGTYSNVTELHRMLYKTILRPTLTMIEETIQAQLIDPEPDWQGYFVEFDLGEQLKGDPLAVAQQIQTEISSGTLTPNEGRDIQNRARSTNPAADELYMPINNLRPLGTDPVVLPPPPGGDPPPLPRGE